MHGSGHGMWHIRENVGIDDQDLGRVYNHAVALRLIKYIAPHWKRVVFILSTTFVYTLTVMAIPFLIAQTIDTYVNQDDMAGLNFIVAIFVFVAGIQFATQYTQQRILSFVGQKVLLSLRIDLFRHIQKLSLSFFDENETGRVMSRVQNDVQQLQECISIVVTGLAGVLSIVGIVIIMLLMNVQLALITLTVVPILVVILLVWQKYARLAFVRARHAISGVNADLQENISGVRVVQSLNRQGSNIKKFGDANAENLGANLQATRYEAALLPVVEILTAVGLALVILFGGQMVISGAIDNVGILVAFALYIQRFFDPIRHLTMQYGQIQRAMASGSRIFEMLDIQPDIVDSVHAKTLDSIRGQIRYQDVSFGYKQDVPVLKNINLNINEGETVAIVGPTGAGKTTLVTLLQRLYEVSGGNILIDGYDLRDVTLKSLSDQIKVVLQEPYLFSTSVEDNIRYNTPNLSIEDVYSAAKMVGAHEFIMELTDGYQTILMERGSNLSIGQRQLISFARALVANPGTLILDEATANIDTYTEGLIQQAIKELLGNRTAIVVAHRLSTIMDADRIVVLDKGRIIEEGAHDDLLANKGLYFDLHSYMTNVGSGDQLNANGAWDVTLETPRGSMQASCDINVEGTNVTGFWKNESGEYPIRDGHIQGDRVSWLIDMQRGGRSLSLQFSGALAGDGIAGEIDFGGAEKGRFTAKRSGDDVSA